MPTDPKRRGRRFVVALHQNLGPALIRQAVKNGRSLSGQVNWLCFLYLEGQGENITSADISEWSLRHRSKPEKLEFGGQTREG
jgi:hypothetical protein